VPKQGPFKALSRNPPQKWAVLRGLAWAVDSPRRRDSRYSTENTPATRAQFSRGTRLYLSRWPKPGVCHAIFKLRSLFSNRELHHCCCDSTMAASSHLGGFVGQTSWCPFPASIRHARYVARWRGRPDRDGNLGRDGSTVHLRATERHRQSSRNPRMRHTLKARSRKHPGLADSQNCSYTTEKSMYQLRAGVGGRHRRRRAHARSGGEQQGAKTYGETHVTSDSVRACQRHAPAAHHTC